MSFRLAALLASAASCFAADLILHNGRILTVDGKFSVAQAVAISGSRIERTGDNKTVLALRSAKTQVIDLQGKTVVPGLIDSHVHPLEAGLSEYRHKIPPLDSFAAVQAYIRQQAGRVPKGQWIVVPRTFPTRLKELRMPTRTDLDVEPDHPVMFDASYVVIVNSLGLKVSGIDRNTPNPPRGEIVKDAKGEPNGILKNARGLLKGMRREAAFTEAEQFDALKKMLDLYVAAGLTSIGDGGVTDEAPLYQKLKAEGRLPLRVAMTWWNDAARPIEELRREMAGSGHKTNDGDEWLKWAAYKVNVDGGMTIGTAYQRHPYGPFGRQLYGKTDPDDRGQLFESPAKLLDIMRAARDRGWQLTAHAQGGGAVDGFIDAMEALDREKPIAPTRSHLIHASFQSPEALARMKRLGLLGDVQAAWLYFDGPGLEKVFGYDGLRYFFPLRSYRRNGVMIAGGSDHMIGWDKNTAVNPYNPFMGLWTEVTRKTSLGKVLHPEERITREEALRSYTIWGAWRQFEEKNKGSIEAGKLADLVVIDRDYMTCPEDDIARIEPVMTIVGGKVAWRAGAR